MDQPQSFDRTMQDIAWQRTRRTSAAIQHLEAVAPLDPESQQAREELHEARRRLQDEQR